MDQVHSKFYKNLQCQIVSVIYEKHRLKIENSYE